MMCSTRQVIWMTLCRFKGRREQKGLLSYPSSQTASKCSPEASQGRSWVV